MQVTSQKIIQWISEGRGQGHGKEYIPWLLIKRRQSPTGGSLQYRYIPQFDRYAHLMSKQELDVVRFLLWVGVVDVREQFPCWPWPHPHPLYQHSEYCPTTIPWSNGTLACARDLGIKHPNFPGTNIPYIPTLDMLVTLPIAGSLRAVAIAVKPDEDEVRLTDEDIEKLAIQKEYALGFKIPWKLMSGSMIPATLASNLKILIHYSVELNDGLNPGWKEFLDVLNSSISTDITIDQSLRLVELDTKLSREITLNLFNRALWFRRTKIDLREAIVMSCPPILSDYDWVQSAIDYLFGE